MKPSPRHQSHSTLAGLVLALYLTAASPPAAAIGSSDFAKSLCRETLSVRYNPVVMQHKLDYFQLLMEETLSLRAQSIQFRRYLDRKLAANQPLLGSDLQILNQGTAQLLAQRDQLYAAAEAHECWLEEPSPADPKLAQVQAQGIALSLAAALTLYDNYLSVVTLYRNETHLRQQLNRGDSGFAIPQHTLREMAAAFTSAINRRRVRRGIDWYGAHAQNLAGSQSERERYLTTLIDQSPAYHLVSRVRPLNYAGNVLDLLGNTSVDTLASLQREGINLTSMLFGNVVGLVETRHGKLYDQDQLQRLLKNDLQAGDVLLEKTPFRLTDSFIPGYWGHAAVWIGSEQELKTLELWQHPLVIPHHQAIREGRQIVEALRSGVEINSLQHFLNIDDLAILRHRQLSREQKREVILQTLRQVGKAYDFNFDTQSTDRIVCSELVYHAYGQVQWPTEKQLGRYVVSPDHIAQQATGNGDFNVVTLYLEGQEITRERSNRLAALVVPELAKLSPYQAGAEIN